MQQFSYKLSIFVDDYLLIFKEAIFFEGGVYYYVSQVLSKNAKRSRIKYKVSEFLSMNINHTMQTIFTFLLTLDSVWKSKETRTRSVGFDGGKESLFLWDFIHVSIRYPHKLDRN